MIVFDYVVIGAGTAGGVLARRLVERGSSVALVEAGGASEHLYVRMPAAFAFAIGNKKFDWNLLSEEEAGMNKRRIPVPRGRIMGGSSAINAMAFVRGQSEDFDGWAKNHGLKDWTYANCLPYFKKLETYSGGSSDWRGGHGPYYVTKPAMQGKLDRSFALASRQAGFLSNDDTNAESQEGFGTMDQSIRHGERVSSTTAYLRGVGRTDLLGIFKYHEATSILIEDGRAAGVVCTARGKKVIFRARREVLLAAGAIGSPKLLMHSGIGPQEHLRQMNIDVIVDSTDVGKNLQDHVDVTCAYLSHEETMSSALNWYRKPLIFAQWLFSRTGPGTTNHFEQAGYIRSVPSVQRPDTQICFIPLLYEKPRHLKPARHGFQATIMGLRPKSRGEIKLADADPRSSPRLFFNYLHEPDDLVALREGIRHFRNIVSQPAMRAITGAELRPGEAICSDDALDAFIRATSKSTHHPCGTCRMGADPAAVVDNQGRVKGVADLRVVDASIMPEITSGNINAPVLMIAEKIADCITRSRC